MNFTIFAKVSELFSGFSFKDNAYRQKSKLHASPKRFLNGLLDISTFSLFFSGWKKILDISSHLVHYSLPMLYFFSRALDQFLPNRGRERRKNASFFSAPEEIGPLCWCFYIVYVVYLYNNNYTISYDWLESEPAGFIYIPVSAILILYNFSYFCFLFL